MNIRTFSPKGFVAPTLSLLALTGLACWLPIRLAAQTQPPPMPDKDKTAKTDTKSDTKTENKPEAKPENKPDAKPDDKTSSQRANPVVLPEHHVPPTLVPGEKTNPKDHPDYRVQGRPNGPTAKTLPLFGYEFFKPQRDMIEEHRAFLKRLREERLRGNRNGANGATGTDNTGDNPQNENGASGGNANPGTTPATPPSTTPTPNVAGAPVRPGVTNNVTGNNNQPTDANAQEDANNGTPRTGNNTRSNDQAIASNQQIMSMFDIADPLDQRYRGIMSTPPANYTLGPGDYLQIQYSSPTIETATLNRYVDLNGAIVLQGLAPVNVTGKTLEGAEKALTMQLRRFYNNVQVTVSLNRLRSIQVNVSGKAYLPGSYSVPSVTTALNMLLAAGGPTEEGSFRAIEVRRQGRLIATIDLYKDLLLGTGKAQDIPLQSGDMIIIPQSDSKVAVSGEVRTQALFELLPGETLADTLRYARGVKPSGVDQRIQISSVDPGSARVLRDVDLKKPGADKTLIYDGDSVEVFSVRARFANTVTIEGAVDQPSDYALTPGMKVSELLDRARGLLNEAYPVADLHRWQPDNTDSMMVIDLEKAMAHDPKHDIALTKWDRIKVYTRDEVAWTGHRVVTISGAVKKYGKYTHSKNMRVSDLLRMAGGPQPDAYLERAILIHQHDDGPPTLEYVNLNAVIRGDQDKDILIQDNDNLAVYSVGQAQFTPDHIVSIMGEVVAPGYYPRAESMKISDLLILSGGFRPSAGSKVVITHARRIADTPNASNTLTSVTINFDSQGKCAPGDDIHLEDGDVVTIQGQGGFIDHVQTINVKGAVNNPGMIPLTSKNMRLSDALQKAGGLRPEAFPQGAEFYRDPKILETGSQRSLAASIGSLNDLLNDSEYMRDRARAQLEVITATGQAAEDAAGGLAGLSSLTGSTTAATTASNAATGVAQKISPGDLVSPARRMSAELIEPDGNISINLPGALGKPKGPDDIVLQEGDTITIPETPTTVQIVGAVYHQRGVLFKPGMKLQQYVDEAGGFAPDAAKDRIEVIRVGGGLTSGKKVRQILPGDVIVVPNKVLAASIARHSNGINDFFKSLTSSALIFKFATSIFGL